VGGTGEAAGKEGSDPGDDQHPAEVGFHRLFLLLLFLLGICFCTCFVNIMECHRLFGVLHER
jgi:hypothetical protein